MQGSKIRDPPSDIIYERFLFGGPEQMDGVNPVLTPSICSGTLNTEPLFSQSHLLVSSVPTCSHLLLPHHSPPTLHTDSSSTLSSLYPLHSHTLPSAPFTLSAYHPRPAAPALSLSLPHRPPPSPPSRSPLIRTHHHHSSLTHTNTRPGRVMPVRCGTMRAWS